MWSRPGTLPFPSRLRFSIVFAYRVNGFNLPRHSLSVRNRLGSAKDCAMASRRSVQLTFGRCWRQTMWLSLSHATSCVRHAVADLTLRWEEVCFSFGHYWLFDYWLTTLGSSHCRQSTHRVLALDRFGVALLGCQYPWHSNAELTSILCGHQAVAGLTPSWEEVCFGLQQCQTDAYLSTMLIVHGIRRRADPSVLSQCFSLHGLPVLCVLVPSALTLLLRHAVFSCQKPLVHPLGALLPWQTG